MSLRVPIPSVPSGTVPSSTLASPDLFAWQGGRVVILVEPNLFGSRWYVVRGWRSGDRLTDIRRWSFAAARPMAGQIRRLVEEATGDTALAAQTSTAAAAWAAVHSGSSPQ